MVAVLTAPVAMLPDYVRSQRALLKCKKSRRFRASSEAGCADDVGSRLLNSISRARMPRACASGTGNCCCLVEITDDVQLVRALRFSINGLSCLREFHSYILRGHMEINANKAC